MYLVVIPAHPVDAPLEVATFRTYVECDDIDACHDVVASLCNELDEIGLCVGPAYGQRMLVRPASGGFGLSH